MKRFLLAILSVMSIPSVAQKIEKYYDYHWKVTDIPHAAFYSKIVKADSGWHRTDYFIHGLVLQMDGYYTDTACTLKSGRFAYFFANKKLDATGLYLNNEKQGLWVSFHSNGMMKDSTVYEEGKPIGISQGWYRDGSIADSSKWNADGSHSEVGWFNNGSPSLAGFFDSSGKEQGKWKYFYNNGKVSAIEIYDHGTLVDKHYFDETGNAVSDTTNTDCEAVLTGGDSAWTNYISKHSAYPSQYKIANAEQATVVVTALIDVNGNLMDAEVSIPFYLVFDKLALQVIRASPKWVPARKHNRRVPQSLTQAITFRNGEESYFYSP